MKMVHNMSYELLGNMFSLPSEEVGAREIFYRILVHQYLHHCNIPAIIDTQGNINDEEVNKALTMARNYGSKTSIFSHIAIPFIET